MTLGGRIRRLASLLPGAVTAGVAAIGTAWLLGRIVSDRFGWSQWLLWIPTPAVLAAAAVALAVAARRDDRPGRRRRRLAAWGTALVVLLAYFGLVEHRFLRRGPEGEAAFRLVHASVQATGPRVLAAHGAGLVGLDGDVTIVSTLLPMSSVNRLNDGLAGLGEHVTVWPFVLFTDLPVIEARPLVANLAFRAVVFRVDATATLGRILTIWVVDLPSDPRTSRHAIAQRSRRILDTVTSAPPDVVVGDFNMTRGSASLATLFPEHRHAFDEAGRGYGATFRRGFPLYHIDHALLGEGVHAAGYDVVDIGVGRHLVQVVDLR